VTPTTTTLTTLRARLRQDLHDEDSNNYRWTDNVLNRHIARAVRELGLVLAREQLDTLSTAAGSREISIAALTDLVRVEAVEWPTGQYPPAYVPFSVYETTLTLLVETAPAAVEDVNVFWGKLHTVDGSTCTVPAAAEEALLLGAAGYAAVEWASFATNRANVAGAAAAEHYRAWGEEQLTRFREQLKHFGERSRLRAMSLFTPEEPAGRHVVTWEP
jgi:hypothetical protein